MSPNEVARRLRDFSLSQSRVLGTTPKLVAGAIVSIDPTTVESPFPSENGNGIRFLGCDQSIGESDLDDVIGIFRERRIGRYFIWPSPGPQETAIVAWLQDRGLVEFRGPRRATYPTFSREAVALPPHRTSLTIRRVQADEVARTGDPNDFFEASLGHEGFEHFIAFEGDAAVGRAVLAIEGDLGYLGWAGTVESHRRKGGQSALIVARVNRAAELRCRVVVSETLSPIYSGSIRNLEAKGFRQLYLKRVFSWGLEE